MYDHSGITIKTTRFDCPWDSGQVGYIYVTKAKIREAYGCQRVGKLLAAKALSMLKAEVTTYDLFITGQVYGYEVADSDGEVVDSCWGFITDDLDSIVEEAKLCIE
jgi:hypothetical protein